jgi:hypothetical protein
MLMVLETPLEAGVIFGIPITIVGMTIAMLYTNRPLKFWHDFGMHKPSLR